MGFWESMKYVSFILTTLMLAACMGETPKPQPSPSGPTPDAPIYFSNLVDGQQFLERRPISVALRLLESEEFKAVSLLADKRPVRLKELYFRYWESDPLDDVLLTFAPGEHILTAIAETLSGNTFTKSIRVYVAPADFRVTGVTIQNAETKLFYPGSNPVGTGVVPEIPLEDLEGQGIVFKTLYTGDLSRVSFSLTGLNGAGGSFYTREQPFDFAVNRESDELLPGDYTVSLTPVKKFGGQELEGNSYSSRLRVVGSKMKVITRSLELIESIQRGVSAQAEVVIENTGNSPGAFQFKNIPPWLSLDSESGTVDSGERLAIIVTAMSCTTELRQEAELTVAAGAGTANVLVKHECVDGPLFDLSLDRFYFNQSVPANDSHMDSEGSSVDLVAGRKGIARAFVTASQSHNLHTPVVRLSYRTANNQQGSFDFVGPSVIPKAIFEGSLEQTFNANLPEDFFALGTEIYVIVDPDNEIAERFENNNRYPTEGYMPLSIRDVPILDLTFVPLLKSGEAELPDLSDEQIAELAQSTMALMPLENYNITVRPQPFVYTSSSWSGVLNQFIAMHQAEETESLYFGIVSQAIDDSGISGLATFDGKAAIALPKSRIVAHELGHLFGLRHADCGSPSGVDPDYPHENAQTNQWGYDIFSQNLKAPSRPDFMSYCRNEWIGAYHYKKIMLKRGGTIYPKVIPIEDKTSSTTEKTLVAKASLNTIEYDQELLIIRGTVDKNGAQIDQVYRAEGYAEAAPSTSPFSLRLLDSIGREIYQSTITVMSTGHTSEQLFFVKVPSADIEGPIAKVLIERKGVVYLAEDWQSSNTQKLATLHSAVNVKRLSSASVEIRWPADGETSLWLSDNQTGNILAIDTSGHVIVYTENNTLQFRYTKQGDELIKAIVVQ